MSARVLSGRDAALRHIELLTGSRDTPVHVRLLDDGRPQKLLPRMLHGTLGDVWPEIENRQTEGYGVFIVVNDGGNADAEITRIRCVFVDADGAPIPDNWHVPPDFIVQRDATHWHAYWRVLDLAVEKFRAVQKRLAAHYGTDTAICNPSRVMRLAGTLHQKDRTNSIQVKLNDCSGDFEPCLLGRSEHDLLRGLSDLRVAPAKQLASPLTGEPFTPAQLTAMLACLDPNCRYNEWRDIAAALHAAPCTDAGFDKRELFVRWSRGEVRNV